MLPREPALTRDETRSREFRSLGRVLRGVGFIGAMSFAAPAACGAGDETSQTHANGSGGDASSSGGMDGGLAGSGAEGGAGGSAGSAGALGGSAGAAGGDADVPNVGDAGSDVLDATIDAPISQSCGDGIRDPITEECDDATGSVPPDSCDSECRVEDVLVHSLLPPEAGSPFLTRRLGVGRHTVAAGDSGFAVVSVQSQPAPTTISLRAFDTKGVPGGSIEINDSSILMASNPTVAALPGGKYALVYTDNGADGGNRGVALRIINPTTQSVGALHRVNATTLGNQTDADVIWTGSELVVAWVDESKLTTVLLDTVLRKFSASGSAIGGEVALANGADSDADVTLTEANGDWAAAWRTFTGAGIPPTVSVRWGTTSWSVSLTSAGSTDEKPILVVLDATHLLLFFVDGSGGPIVQRVRGAILDKAAPGTTASFSLDPLVEPYASDLTLWQRHVTAVRAGNRAFVAWRSKPVVGSQDTDEIWLKEISWDSSGGAFTLDLSSQEIPLPRSAAHRKGGQERPALALMALPFENALATTWEDYARVFGPIEGQPDVVAELIPLPIVRLPDADGGLGK